MFTLRTKGLTEPVTLKNLPTLRQSFVVAATLIILGYVLGYYINDLFTLLPLLVAGGLMVAGLSGVCPMVCILQKLPGNGPAEKSPTKDI